MSFPLNKQLVDQTCIDFGLRNAKELGASSIRQLVGVVKDIERATGVEFVHMELGEPGLPAEQIGIMAEHKALKAGMGSKYPLITGITEVKHWGSEFVRAFMNLDIPTDCIVPPVGSMQAAFSINMLVSQLDEKRDTILFLDPCFPVQKQQCKVIGVRVDSFDVADFRGEALAKEAGAPLQAANMVLLGAAIPMLGIDHDKIVEGVKRIFARKGEAIVAANLAAIEAGYQVSNI